MGNGVDRRTVLKAGLAVPAGLAMGECLGVKNRQARADRVSRKDTPMPFRQVHLDFHTSERIAGIGEKFDPEEFASVLAGAHVNSVTCFARCHHGYIYYDTKLFPQRRHPHLKRNLLKEQIEACHQRGIRVPIYTTVHWDHFTANEHPEWLMRDEKGQVVGQAPGETGFYRRLCLNTPYVDLLKRHLSELFELLPVDGLFLDIVHEIECCCASCTEGMKKQGLDPARAEDRGKYARQINVAFKRDISRHIRGLSEDSGIFYNAGHIGPYIRPSADTYTHFEMESLPGGAWGYMHFPLTARYVRTLGKPYLGMTGRFHTSWGDFHSYKNQAALEFECFNMLAMGAGCSIGDQLHPSGRMDQATYDLIGAVYSQVEKKEPWCRGATPMVEIAVMSAEEFIGGRMPPPSVGALRMLQEGAHQFDMVDSQSELSPYRVLILPDKITLAPPLAQKLRTYLKGGGSIVASFESGLNTEKTAFVLDEFPVRNVGARVVDSDGNDVRGRVYARNDYAEYILPHGSIGRGLPQTEHVMHMKGMDVEAREGAEVLTSKIRPYFDRTPEHFCSHRQTPSSGTAGGPAVVRGGRIIYFAHPIFTQYHENAPKWCRQILLNTLDMLLPEPLIRVKAPSTAIVTVNQQKQQGRWVVHLLHYVPERRGQAFDVIEDVLPVYGIEVTVRVPDAVRRVVGVPQGQELEFSGNGGRVHFTVPRLDGHQIISLEF